MILPCNVNIGGQFCQFMRESDVEEIIDLFLSNVGLLQSDWSLDTIEHRWIDYIGLY